MRRRISTWTAGAWDWRGPAGLAAGMFCLWLAFRGVDRSRLAEVLVGADAARVLAAGLLSLAVSAVKCTKLGVLLGPEWRPSYRTLLAAEMSSVLVDVVFPLRLQELVKAYAVGRARRVPASRVFGAVFVEKLGEMSLLLVSLVVLSLRVAFPSWLLKIVWLALPAVVAALLAARIVSRWDRPCGRLLDRVARFAGTRVREALRHLALGVRHACGHGRRLAAVLAITLGEWLLLGLTARMAAASLGFRLSALETLGLVVANLLAFAVPSSSSASIGIYELAGSAALVVLFGMPREEALALVVILHLVLAGFGVLGGIWGLSALGVRLRDLYGLRGRGMPGSGS